MSRYTPRQRDLNQAECAPTGPLRAIALPTRTRCLTCECVLILTWTRDGTDFYWADEEGRMIGGRPPHGFPSGYHVLSHLSRPGATDREMAAYSQISAARALGSLWPWEHPHMPAPTPPNTVPVPECCGSPMRATRDGWLCRVRRSVVPYEGRS